MREQRRMKRRPMPTKTKVVIGIIIGICLLAIWQFIFAPRTDNSSSPFWLLTGGEPPLSLKYPSLLALGINIEEAREPSKLNEQQALLIAKQLQPEVATQSTRIQANYVEFDFPLDKGSTAHPDFRDVRAWLIWFQEVPLLDSASYGADPDDTAKTHHDLYLFIDADTGRELLSLWV